MVRYFYNPLSSATNVIDPYMFHQPNLRSYDAGEVLVNRKMQKLSLLQMWVETVVAEITRLVDWPIVTLKHDHVSLQLCLSLTHDEGLRR